MVKTKIDKCTHCLHPPNPNKKIPYFCGNHWYCSRHCYEEELKHPHISHLLDPKHPEHDPHAKNKHPTKDKDHSNCHAHADHHKQMHNLHAQFEDMERQFRQVHHHDKDHHTHHKKNPVHNNIFPKIYGNSTFGDAH